MTVASIRLYNEYMAMTVDDMGIDMAMAISFMTYHWVYVYIQYTYIYIYIVYLFICIIYLFILFIYLFVYYLFKMFSITWE